MQGAERAGERELVEAAHVAAAHGPRGGGGQRVVVVGPGRAPVGVVPGLAGREVAAAAVQLVPVHRVAPEAGIEAEGHEPGQAPIVHVLQGRVQHGRHVRVVAGQARRQRAHREFLDGAGAREPLRGGPRAQGMVERRPHQAIEIRPRRLARERADGQGREESLPGTQPDGVVGDVHGQPAVGQQAQRLRLVAVHVVEGHGHGTRPAADRQQRGVGLLPGGAAGAGDLDVEGQRRVLVRAPPLAHPRPLSGRGRGLDRRCSGAADRGHRKGRAEVEGERVADAVDPHGVGRAPAGQYARGAAAVALPLHHVAHDGGGRAGGEDVTAQRAEGRGLVRAVDHHHRRERPRVLHGDAAGGGVIGGGAVDDRGQRAAGDQPGAVAETDLVEERAGAAAQHEPRGAGVDGDLVALPGQRQRDGGRRVRPGRAVGDDPIGRAAVRPDRSGKRDQQPLDWHARHLAAGVPAREDLELGGYARAARVDQRERVRVDDAEAPRQRHPRPHDFALASHAGGLANGEDDRRLAGGVGAAEQDRRREQQGAEEHALRGAPALGPAGDHTVCRISVEAISGVRTSRQSASRGITPSLARSG